MHRANLLFKEIKLSNAVSFFDTSGLKKVLVVNGKITPGGSYTTLNEWIRRVGVDPLVSPDGDIDIFFGNIG